MRIAFVSTVVHHPLGGADTLWTHAAEAAVARGDRVLLGVSRQVAGHPRVTALRRRGAEILERAAPQGSPTRRQRLARRLQALLQTPDPVVGSFQHFRPDLVIFSLGGTYDLVLERPWCEWLQRTRTNFRVIANWQAEHPRLAPHDLAFVREVFAAADAVHFVSRRNLEVTRRHLLAPLERARLTHNPLRWQPADATPWPAGTTARLATVSRLDDVKGVHLLLHAAAEALGARGDWKLAVYGTGPHEAYLRATAAFLGLSAQVEFRGHVADLREIWAGNHLLCSPAIDDGVPMTIPEAMLCGRPVLATCVGGAEDWLRDGETGFLCPAPTVPLLARALREAFARRELWPRMGEAAAAAARALYRPDDYLQLIA